MIMSGCLSSLVSRELPGSLLAKGHPHTAPCGWGRASGQWSSSVRTLAPLCTAGAPVKEPRYASLATSSFFTSGFIEHQLSNGHSVGCSDLSQIVFLSSST